jgi:restriction system protein
MVPLPTTQISAYNAASAEQRPREGGKFMAVPDFQTLMLPVLREFADGAEHATKDVRQRVASQLALTAEDVAEVVPSGTQTRLANRVAWAHVYMKRAGLLSSVRRGVYRITERGQEVLKAPPPRITIQFLEQYPEFAGFRSPAEPPDLNGTDPALLKIMTAGIPASIDHPASLTPDEQVHIGAARIKENLVAQILERVKQGTPAAFERVVIDMLVAMGYGGSHDDAAQVVGKSGDSGIDGIIKEDRLGLESIYVQAKRWEDTTVGRPAIQQFAGALQGHRARKGVFITTSSFSREAIEYAKGLQTTIVLIDGTQLADYMIEFGVGVTDVETIRLKRLDEDYFGDE